jgi:hypothetical protein
MGLGLCFSGPEWTFWALWSFAFDDSWWLMRDCDDKAKNVELKARPFWSKCLENNF